MPTVPAAAQPTARHVRVRPRPSAASRTAAVHSPLVDRHRVEGCTPWHGLTGATAPPRHGGELGAGERCTAEATRAATAAPARHETATTVDGGATASWPSRRTGPNATRDGRCSSRLPSSDWSSDDAARDLASDAVSTGSGLSAEKARRLAQAGRLCATRAPSPTRTGSTAPHTLGELRDRAARSSRARETDDGSTSPAG